MNEKRVAPIVMALAILLAGVSSVMADAVYEPQSDLNLNHIAPPSFVGVRNIESSCEFVEHFGEDNGKHLGFGVAASHGGLRITLVRSQPLLLMTQNPEPTTIVLLGTGLAAAASLARKRRQKR